MLKLYECLVMSLGAGLLVASAFHLGEQAARWYFGLGLTFYLAGVVLLTLV